MGVNARARYGKMSRSNLLKYVRRNFDEAAILAVAAKLAFETEPNFDDSELATLAAMRRAHPSAGTSNEELSQWLSEMDADQMVGVVSNTKGVLHEMEFAEIENTDGDSVYAAIFPETNNPGYDLEFTDTATGETWAVQLKATDSTAYVEAWLSDHPDGNIIVTDELGESLDLPSSNITNEELTVRTEDLVDKLIQANESSEIWEYLPGIGAVPMALII